MLLEFYAASGDFTRRLTSVKANAKFSSPTAGPDDYFSVRLSELAPPADFEMLLVPVSRLWPIVGMHLHCCNVVGCCC